MSDLRQLITELSNREMTRKQFLTLVGGSFLGMMGFFRFMQSISTPGLADSNLGVFGEKEYGHEKVAAASKARKYDEDVFG